MSSEESLPEKAVSHFVIPRRKRRGIQSDLISRKFPGFPFGFAQGGESFDSAQDREAVERPVEWQMGVFRQPRPLLAPGLCLRRHLHFLFLGNSLDLDPLPVENECHVVENPSRHCRSACCKEIDFVHEKSRLVPGANL